MFLDCWVLCSKPADSTFVETNTKECLEYCVSGKSFDVQMITEKISMGVFNL